MCMCVCPSICPCVRISLSLSLSLSLSPSLFCLSVHPYVSTIATLLRLTPQLAAGGLDRYETSNFARAGFESWHNTAYWLAADWIALGPGA
jgi:hypothetical protein